MVGFATLASFLVTVKYIHTPDMFTCCRLFTMCVHERDAETVKMNHQRSAFETSLFQFRVRPSKTISTEARIIYLFSSNKYF